MELELLGTAAADIPWGVALYRTTLGMIYGTDQTRLPPDGSILVRRSGSGPLLAMQDITRHNEVWYDPATGDVYGIPPHRSEPRQETWRDRPPLL